MNQWLTKDQAAAYLRISVRTLDKLIACREVAAARIGGRRLLFDEADLDRYVRGKLAESLQN